MILSFFFLLFLSFFHLFFLFTFLFSIPSFPFFFLFFLFLPCLQNGVGAYERRSLARTPCRALIFRLHNHKKSIALPVTHISWNAHRNVWTMVSCSLLLYALCSMTHQRNTRTGLDRVQPDRGRDD